MLGRPQQDAVHQLHDRRFNLAGQLVLRFFHDLQVIDGAVDKVVEILNINDAADVDIVDDVIFILLHAVHAVVLGFDRHLLLFFCAATDGAAPPLDATRDFAPP